MRSDGKVKKVFFDRKGRLICPECRAVMQIPPDRYLKSDFGKCPAGHWFHITFDTAYAVNDILSRENVNRWRKKVLKEKTEEDQGPKTIM